MKFREQMKINLMMGALHKNSQAETLSDYMSDGATCQHRMSNASKHVENHLYTESKKQRYMQPHVIFLLILIFGLSTAVAFLSYLYVSETQNYSCNSEDCIRSALNLLVSLDESVDPCTDFYQYACGSWHLQHPIPDDTLETDWFNDRKENLLISIKEFLTRNDSDTEPFPVHQARVLYRSCLNDVAANEIGIEPILEVLNQTHLPFLVPLDGPNPSFNWVSSAVLAKLYSDKDFFISFSVSQDTKNRTINRLSISKPTGESPLPIHRDFEKIYKINIRNLEEHFLGDQQMEGNYEDVSSSSEEETDDLMSNSYVSYVFAIIAKFHAMQGASFSWDQFPRPLLGKLINFTANMEKLSDKTYSNSTTMDPTQITIVELQNLTDTIFGNASVAPIIDWREYFQLMFQDTNVTLNFEQEEYTLLIANVEYVMDVFDLIAKTDLQTIELYMWWEMISLLIPYTTVEMRQAHSEFMYDLTGRRIKESRTLTCAQCVNEMMGMAVSYMFVDSFQLNMTKVKVADMVNNIHWAFRQIVSQIDWMDEKTKEATLKKAKAMKTLIGYPSILVSKTELESYYDGIVIEEDQFLRNMLKKIQTVTQSALSTYRDPYDFDSEESWATDPTDVNAFHWSQANAITIPAGILQFPFYGHGIEALNYGAIGSILGHEITHGFDDTGKKFNEFGNQNVWWTNNTIREYKERTKCFIEHYNQYSFPELNETVDGMLTLDENIADNGGLRESLMAYRRFVSINGAEPKLPGLEKYSHEQLLFLSFANTWCENSNSKNLYQIRDVHSPNKVRVQEVLRNSNEFSKVWKCPKGSSMNPYVEKCRIW